MGGWGWDVRNGRFKIIQLYLYSKLMLYNHNDERMLERKIAHGAIKCLGALSCCIFREKGDGHISIIISMKMKLMFIKEGRRHGGSIENE